MARAGILAFIVATCGALGIVSAMMAKIMYDRGIILRELVTGTVTIEDVMFIILLFWIIIGIFFAAREAR